MHLESIGMNFFTNVVRILGSMIIFAACSDQQVSYPPYPAVVYGRITTSRGAPVSNARIHVLGFRDTCNSGISWNDHEASYLSEENGSFRISFPTPGNDRPLCFLLQVAPPESLAVSAASVGPFQPAISNDPYKLAFDSTEVNVVLR